MTDYPTEDDLEEPPFSASPTLSVVQSVQFMIEGDKELNLPLAYETVAGGTILQRLKFCLDKAKENHASSFPDEARSTAELAKANHAMFTANQYLLALQNELPAAKTGLHPLLQWDEHVSKMEGCDHFLKGSIIHWAHHKYQVNPFGLYAPPTELPHAQQPVDSTNSLDGTPAVHAADAPGETSGDPSGTDDPGQSEADANIEVTLFLVADALSRQLNALDDDTSTETDEESPFGNNEGIINCSALAKHILEECIPTPAGALSDEDSHRTPPRVPHEVSKALLCLLTHRLAELLDAAIERGDLEVWRDAEKAKKENYLKSNGTYNSQAIQRYLAKYILLNGEFPGQAERAILERLSNAKNNFDPQESSSITEVDLLARLESATEQYQRAKPES